MRIKNLPMLISHGNRNAKSALLQIMEAGLNASDPYANTLKLIRREKNTLYVGNKAFEADGDPNSGVDQIDLEKLRRIIVVGAGKGVQRVAKAIEEVLGEYLTGGHVIAKYGDEVILKRIGVTLAGHPTPDDNCVKGCKEILKWAVSGNENDLVITIFGNGGSSLLTLPCEGIELAEVTELTRVMQIEKGVQTRELNIVRNHIDQMKGGKISRAFWPARMIHIIMTDASRHVFDEPRHDYYHLLSRNIWLHNLSEGTTFEQAVDVLKHHDAWDNCPSSIRKVLTEAKRENDTVRYNEFIQSNFRVFGIMPDDMAFVDACKQKAAELGYTPYFISRYFRMEPTCLAQVLAGIAMQIEDDNQPVCAPAVLLSTGEMTVSCGSNRDAVGGRNQEFALEFARMIAGSKRIAVASADTDGTDGPGGLEIEGAPQCLAGGVVDGYSYDEMLAAGCDVDEEIRTHNTSECLWKAGCGLHVEQSISLCDLTAILIQDTEKQEADR